MSKRFLIDTQEIKVAVDMVVVAYHDQKLHTLLIQREFDPDAGKWALPGGFIRNDEELEDAVERVLADETGIQKLEYKAEIGTFGQVERDSRSRVISISYLLLTNTLWEVSGQKKDYQATKDARWIEWNSMPSDLAFDHEQIFKRAKKYIADNLYAKPIAACLLPEKFTYSELKHLYEQLLNTALEKRNFRKTINSRDFLVGLNEKKTGSHRPAQLFKFKKRIGAMESRL